MHCSSISSHAWGGFNPVLLVDRAYPVKKEKIFFLIYKEIQEGSGAKSYMRKGFLIYCI
jgi:hypothetical protein